MRLLWIELRDFRNHEQTKLDTPDGLLTAVGPNGEGKTNLLEGMFFLLSLASPRVSASEPLVRRGAESAFVRGEVQGLEGRSLIEVEIRTVGANRVQVNGSPVRRKRDVRKLIRGVFFGPDDLAIVQGDPGERRRFLDEAVVTLWPARETAMNAYLRTVRQRNRLLKDWMGSGAPQGIEAWDEELIQHGSAVIRTRAEAIERLAPPAAAEFKSLSGYELAVEYRPSVQGEDAELEATFRVRLDERRDDELVRRTTLVGPHRDDVHLGVRDFTARGFASHGEAWGAALSLRLGLATAVAEEVGEAPVVLLDDPFSALDPVRRTQVAEKLNGRGQIVVSVADSGHVPPESDLVWLVSGGSVEVESGVGKKGSTDDAVE